jgi:hypothetical protein
MARSLKASSVLSAEELKLIGAKVLEYSRGNEDSGNLAFVIKQTQEGVLLDATNDIKEVF